jgi:hypothetical protein
MLIQCISLSRSAAENDVRERQEISSYNDSYNDRIIKTTLAVALSRM